MDNPKVHQKLIKWQMTLINNKNLTEMIATYVNQLCRRSVEY